MGRAAPENRLARHRPSPPIRSRPAGRAIRARAPHWPAVGPV